MARYYVYPREFIPEYRDDTPDYLFPYNGQCERYVNRFNQRNMLIYTDGACSNNGYNDASSGWAFVYKRGIDGTCGYYGDGGGTSNRAELRAVLSALNYRKWYLDGYTRVTIASDSQYVVDGATQWTRNWVRNGWVSSNRNSVKNRDLWQQLLDVVTDFEDRGCQVNFWWIPRHLNTRADSAAKSAAEQAARAGY